jgi:hypothetical protein
LRLYKTLNPLHLVSGAYTAAIARKGPVVIFDSPGTAKVLSRLSLESETMERLYLSQPRSSAGALSFTTVAPADLNCSLSSLIKHVVV